MKFRHFTSEPRTLDLTKKYRPETLGYKPEGLWISNEDDLDSELSWSQWCKGENWNLESLTYEHEVQLKDDSCLIILNDCRELDEFTHEFSDTTANLGHAYGKYEQGQSTYIRWGAIQEMFDGILIPTYQWNRRMSLMWYYSWDCGSGCIWNLDAIKSFKLVENTVNV